MRRTDLVLRYTGGYASGERGVEYPVALRNRGASTFWDVTLRVLHDGTETDRKLINQVGPELETAPVDLRIPTRYCDVGSPGIGVQPLGRVTFEALIEDETVAVAELPRPDSQIERVPRTPEEEAELLRMRPSGWEYLLFAAVLRRRMDALKPKFSDHELRYAVPSYEPVLEGYEATERISAAFRHASAVIQNFSRLLDPVAQECAFGPLGKAGDPASIEHLARRLIDVYEGLLDWAARLRGLPVEERFERVVELSSSFVDKPVGQLLDFVGRVVAEIDPLPSLLREESPEPISIELTCTLSIDEEVQRELSDELARLENTFGA
jgi:hypothetical protein